ncbi:MAG: hypothetical protein HC861_11545 [Rhodospirillaceae bacterium]|nr:hypothetical protein [Rhodospirillaceae bacterium]
MAGPIGPSMVMTSALLGVSCARDAGVVSANNKTAAPAATRPSLIQTRALALNRIGGTSSHAKPHHQEM